MIILRYKTSYWVPPIAEVTLRTARNDWKDFTGRSENGGWTFEPEAIYAGTVLAVPRKSPAGPEKSRNSALQTPL